MIFISSLFAGCHVATVVFLLSSPLFSSSPSPSPLSWRSLSPYLNQNIQSCQKRAKMISNQTQNFVSLRRSKTTLFIWFRLRDIAICRLCELYLFCVFWGFFHPPFSLMFWSVLIRSLFSTATADHVTAVQNIIYQASTSGALPLSDLLMLSHW